MVRAWYMDNSDADQRLPHMLDPTKFLTLEEVYQKTRVEYFQINADDHVNDETLQTLRKARGYTYEDVCDVSPQTLPDYDKKLKMFFEEHLHKDEEIRLIVDGSGYFDVRDDKDDWIRVELLKGDMLILPAGIYHRFTMDEKDYIKAVRYFVGEPVWTPYNRPCDEDPVRQAYLRSLQQNPPPQVH